MLQTVSQRVRDRDTFLRRVRELYQRRGDVSHDEVELADGRTFERYSAPMQDPDGRYYGRVWYFRDATERKLAEAAVREERDRAQRYLDVAEVLMLALDVEGRITLINRKGCSILGWTEQELIGRDWLGTCVPAHARAGLLERLRALHEGDMNPVESPLLTKSGQERLIRWHNTTVHDESGRLVGTLSSGTDVTEESRAAEALQIAEERMRFALQNAGVGTWDIDFGTGATRWSEISEAQYGLAPGTFGGTFEAFAALVHPDDRAAVLETIGKAAQSGEDFRVEHRTIWPDGTVRWLSCSGRIHLGANGAPGRGAGITMDVTQQKKLEIELHQAQKLESVGRLAAGIAHEINTPVQFVGDSVRFVQEAMADLVKLVANHQAVNEQALAGLPARAAAEEAVKGRRGRRPRLHPVKRPRGTRSHDRRTRPGHPDRPVDEGIRTPRPHGNVAGGPQSRAHEHADRSPATNTSMLRTSKATTATSRGDLPCGRREPGVPEHHRERRARHSGPQRRSVRKGTYPRGTRRDDDAVVVRISDNGTGIPEPIRDRIFDPFFTTKEVGKGTGQGLAIARAVVVEKHRGALTFETQAGAGTTFVIRLPILQPGRAEAAP